MEEKLKSAIERFQNASTSLEAYKAISAFVEIVITVPKYIARAEEVGKSIHEAQMDLHVNKTDYSNEQLAKKRNVFHQLDPLVPLRNLHMIYMSLKPEYFDGACIALFKRFNPNDPLPKADKEEYQMFLDKVYKTILPFLPKEKKQIRKKLAQSKQEIAPLSFDSEKSILHLIGKEVKTSIKQNDRTNGHYVLQHIFTAKEGLKQQYPYAEIAEDTFKSEYTEKSEWRKYYRACMDINDKARKQTGIDDFLIFSTGRTGWARVNEKYLK